MSRSERRDRLVESPVFLLSPPRSGSTLLRVILDTHSLIHAPHELNLRELRVAIDERRGAVSMQQLDLDQDGLDFLLWDRILHRELVASGKPIIVEKTPSNVLSWERFAAAWPQARFIFLRRNPVAIAQSLARAVNRPVGDIVVGLVSEFTAAMDAARGSLDGPDVRYEDLVSDPEGVTQRLCDYLEVPWERTMLDYGTTEHGPYKKRLGDISEKIRSGRIQTDVEVPSLDDVPPTLVDLARGWGYTA